MLDVTDADRERVEEFERQQAELEETLAAHDEARRTLLARNARLASEQAAEAEVAWAVALARNALGEGAGLSGELAVATLAAAVLQRRFLR